MKIFIQNYETCQLTLDGSFFSLGGFSSITGAEGADTSFIGFLLLSEGNDSDDVL